MRACGACGQPVPIRWRNTGPALTVEHIAGPVQLVREDPHPGYPWGRIVDRVQGCAECGVELSRGPWAIGWPVGADVIETGPGHPTSVISPAHGRNTRKCSAQEVPKNVTSGRISGIVPPMTGEPTPHERLRRALAEHNRTTITVPREDLTVVLDELDNLTTHRMPNPVGRPPYGWRAHGGELVRVSHEQETLRRVKVHRDNGMSWRQVAAALTQERRLTRAGVPWSASGISKSFQNAEKYWARLQLNSVNPVTDDTEVHRVSNAS